MKLITLLLLILLSNVTNAQSIELQTAILSRSTADSVFLFDDVKTAQDFMLRNSIDFVMISNSDTVNVFYYSQGVLEILEPFTCDLFLATRDNFGKIIDYPMLFFDRSSYSRRVGFRIGVSSTTKRSSLGVQYGYVR